LDWDNRPRCPYCGYPNREFKPEHLPKDNEEIVVRCKCCACDFTAKCCITYQVEPQEHPGVR